MSQCISSSSNFFWSCFYRHIKALLEALVYMMLWFNCNVMNVVSVVMFYLVNISDATSEFLLGGNKGILN